MITIMILMALILLDFSRNVVRSMDSGVRESFIHNSFLALTRTSIK